MSSNTRVITDAQRRFFEDTGYLVLESFFDDSELTPLIQEITEEIDRLCLTLVQDGRLSRTFEEEDFEHRLTLIHSQSPDVCNAIKAGKLSGPAIYSLLTNPRLLDLAEVFCGPELLASSVYRLRPKMPGFSQGAVPWHQDSGYFEPICDATLILTCWIPLTDATEERGCLWILPSQHRRGVFPHVPHAGKVFLQIPKDQLPPCESVCVPVPKGGLLLFTNTTPHASFDNSSSVIRWSFDVRYQSALKATSPAPSEPQPCYPPEADCLVRSSLRPHAVCKSAEDFRRIRSQHSAGAMTDRWNLKSLGRDGWHGFSETYNFEKRSHK